MSWHNLCYVANTFLRDRMMTRSRLPKKFALRSGRTGGRTPRLKPGEKSQKHWFQAFLCCARKKLSLRSGDSQIRTRITLRDVRQSSLPRDLRLSVFALTVTVLQGLVSHRTLKGLLSPRRRFLERGILTSRTLAPSMLSWLDKCRGTLRVSPPMRSTDY